MHCYLLNGREQGLLTGIGLGVSNIFDEVVKLTGEPITTIATHIHWDHIGGHKYFPDFYAHAEESDQLNGRFPLSIETVEETTVDRCNSSDGFDINNYESFQGVLSKILTDHDIIDLGERQAEVLRAPRHSPGYLCLWEKNTRYLFAGNLIYRGILFVYYPSTDPEAHLNSLKKTSLLPIERVFPVYHSLDIQLETLFRIRKAFEQLGADGKSHHGSDTFNHGDWGVWL